MSAASSNDTQPEKMYSNLFAFCKSNKLIIANGTSFFGQIANVKIFLASACPLRKGEGKEKVFLFSIFPKVHEKYKVEVADARH